LNVVVYSKSNCVWCDRAKNLLNSVDLSFNEIDLSDDIKRNEFYKKIGEGVKTVPQIFIDDIRVGGFPELVTWFEENGF
jgi:glutaredoxin|tara:strand:+ start:1572 stop:1808 length:237 start_codon:yes stop_codon:yes gene_type:complete